MAGNIMQSEESKLLWQPGEEAKRCRMAQYMLWLEREKGLSFPDYASLWEWSVADIEAFWASIWDYFQFKVATPYKKVLSRREMPGATWFEGATLNYADQVLRHTKRRMQLPAALSSTPRKAARFGRRHGPSFAMRLLPLRRHCVAWASSGATVSLPSCRIFPRRSLPS